MLTKKILITAGGTGGHLFPAQALAQEIEKKIPHSEVLFIAGGLASNRYFDREKFSFREVACSPLLSINPLRCIKGLLSLFKGIKQSIKQLRHFQPDIVVGFGSYYTVATLLAARYLKIPVILHEANSIPGKANLWLAPFADCIALHFPSTCKYFKGNTIHVGLPLREGYQSSTVSKEEALSYYGFTEEKKTLLICGGSQGAFAINNLLKNALKHMPVLPIQIIHLTGNEEMKDQLSSLYMQEGITASVKIFEHQMQYAWKAADFFVARAGASTIAEAMEFEVPGILIPYPFATENHQKINAEYLTMSVEGAVLLNESELAVEKFIFLLTECLLTEKFYKLKEALKKHKDHPHQMSLYELISGKLKDS